MAADEARPRILLTGPTRGIEDWARAAESAGWEAVALALVETRPRAVDLAELPESVDWICVTSSSALPWIAEAVALHPELRRARLAVVGRRSAERLAELGLRAALEPALDSRALTDALLAAATRGTRVLWPRGPLSDELGRRLEAEGFAVTAPLAYESEARAGLGAPPQARATFFASPSGVRAYAALAELPRAPGTALAIGRSTFDALMDETGLGFLDTIALPEPTPEALAHVLAHLDPEPPTSRAESAR